MVVEVVEVDVLCQIDRHDLEKYRCKILFLKMYPSAEPQSVQKMFHAESLGKTRENLAMMAGCHGDTNDQKYRSQK